MKNIIYLSALVIFCISCTERIDLELNSGDNLKLVVDAWIDDSDRRQFIDLSLTVDYFEDEKIRYAKDAIITITDGLNTFNFTESDNGRYYMNEEFIAIEGNLYTLNIQYLDKQYTATQTLKRNTEIDAVYYDLYDSNSDDPNLKPEYDIYISMQELEGEGDHYYFNNYLKGDLPIKDLRFGESASDELVDGSYIDSTYVTYGFYEVGDTVVTQMFSITEEVNEYISAIYDQTDRGESIFDSPPANVPTNIIGDGVGFFIISKISEFEKVIR